jgi:hypothetical protein
MVQPHSPDNATSELARKAVASRRRRNGCLIAIALIASMVAVTTLAWWAMQRLAHEAWSAIGQVLPGVTDPHRDDPFNHVIQAINDKNVSEYLAARTACGKKCDPDMDKDEEEGQFVRRAVELRAWPILTAQIQAAPQIAQRLLHVSGSGYGDFDGKPAYDGGPDLVNFLLANGAKADGLALANAVAHCRTEMTRIMLQNGVDPNGKYPIPDRFAFEGPEGLLDPSESLLLLAAENHCDPSISILLKKAGARSTESSPQ